MRPMSFTAAHEALVRRRATFVPDFLATPLGFSALRSSARAIFPIASARVRCRSLVKAAPLRGTAAAPPPPGSALRTPARHGRAAHSQGSWHLRGNGERLGPWCRGVTDEHQSGARRVLSRQNSLPSGSARTCHGSSPVWPMSAGRAPSLRRRSSSAS